MKRNLCWLTVFETIGLCAPMKTASEILDTLTPALGATLEEVEEAVSGLLNLGLVCLSAEGFVKSQDHFYFGDNELPEDEKLKSQQMLSAVSSEVNYYLNNFVAKIEPAAAKKAIEEIKEVFLKHAMNAEQKPGASVFGFVFGTVQLTTTKKF